jgi:hypothetical protein
MPRWPLYALRDFGLILAGVLFIGVVSAFGALVFIP